MLLNNQSHVSLKGIYFNQKRKIFIDNEINKLTLKGDTISCCFSWLIFGGPCHLFCHQTVLGNSLFIQLWTKNIFLSLYYYLRIKH